jgi:hypothetical protein
MSESAEKRTWRAVTAITTNGYALQRSDDAVRLEFGSQDNASRAAAYLNGLESAKATLLKRAEVAEAKLAEYERTNG